MTPTELSQLYDDDFYLWVRHNAELIRQRRFDEIDVDNVVEEIESLGRRDRHEVQSRLATLLRQLLIWRHYPVRCGKDLILAIRHQRWQMALVLQDSPTLQRELPSMLAKRYGWAREMAAIETGLPEEAFPKDCAWSLEQILDEHFWP